MRTWRDGDGAIGEEDIVFFLSQVVRGKIGGRKPATVAERIRAATILLKLYQSGELDDGEEEEDALSAAIREFEEERGPAGGGGTGGSGGTGVTGGAFGEDGFGGSFGAGGFGGSFGDDDFGADGFGDDDFGGDDGFGDCGRAGIRASCRASWREIGRRAVRGPGTAGRRGASLWV